MEQALLNACKNNQLSVIKLLTARGGVNINYRDNFGKTALVYSAVKGNLDAVRHLIENGADTSIEDDFSNTVLHHAVVSKNREVTRFLLGLDSINPNGKNREGNTPLIMAVDVCDRDMVELLLKAGASDLPNNKNQTALDIASAKGLSSIVELILVTQADTTNKPKTVVVTPQPVAPVIKESQVTTNTMQRLVCEQCSNYDLDLSQLEKGIIKCPACGSQYHKNIKELAPSAEKAQENTTEKNKKGWFRK